MLKSYQIRCAVKLNASNPECDLLSPGLRKDAGLSHFYLTCRLRAAQENIHGMNSSDIQLTPAGCNF